MEKKEISDMETGEQLEIKISPKLSYSYKELMIKAMINAKPRMAGEAARWVAVRDTFATGSGVAIELCKHFNLDPFEKIRGIRCLDCDS